jgi:hypothetical protein
MKMKTCVLPLACMAIGFMLAVFASWMTGQAYAAKWEYRIEIAPYESELNQLGSEGWELVFAKPASPDFPTVMHCYFKRRSSEVKAADPPAIPLADSN